MEIVVVKRMSLEPLLGKNEQMGWIERKKRVVVDVDVNVAVVVVGGCGRMQAQNSWCEEERRGGIGRVWRAGTEV